MVNIKWGVVSGGAALVFAFLTSLIFGHTSLAIALLRALIFAAVFFGLGVCIWAVINLFFPELLNQSSGEDLVKSVFSSDSSSSGTQVNITVDDAPDAALPGDDYSQDADHVGDYNDLKFKSANVLGDVDQKPQKSYNDAPAEVSPVFDSNKSGDQGDFSMDFGAFVSDNPSTGVEDFDSAIDDSFSLLAGGGLTGDSTGPSQERKVSVNKPTKFEGDFSPKEIAGGIRTVLEKEKKG